jgi:hypothetical protein
MFKFGLFSWISSLMNFLSPSFGGDGGGSSAPTQSNVVNTNIPEYAQPYVENMLGATQEQLFNTTKDAQGNVSLTGLKPYTPYSANMNDYVAPFSPLQQQAQAKTANLSMPGQFGAGSNLALQSGMGSGQIGAQATQAGNQYNQMATNPYATQAFMNPYIQASLAPQLQEMQRQYGITGANEQGAATRAGAFGGSREALMAAENERNKNMAMNQAIGQGYDKAFQAAQQAQQFGANLGLQGLQTGLTGMGQAGQAGATLGQLGSSQLGAAQGIINMQNQMGQQQQAQEQQKVNQAIQNYATQQQYPLMELGTMSNMLRGLPMQASTTQQYQAAPSSLTQGIGIAGALGSLGQSGIFGGKKEGGVVNSYAEGGIASYDVGGAVKADLERMPTEKLKQLESSAKGIELSQIKQILNDRQQGAMPEFAPGGIVAFAEGTPKDYPDYSSPAEEGTSALERYLKKAKEQKMSTVGDSPTDFGVRAKARREIESQINDLTPGIFTGPKLWDKETSSQIADREAKIAELRAKKAAIPFFAPDEPTPAPAKQGAPAAEATLATEAKQAAEATPAAPATKTIVDPNKSILNAIKVAQDPNKVADVMNAQSPMFSMEGMEKYANQKAEERKKAYIEQVKNAPMSEEGQKLYDSYEDKVKNAKTKEQQNFWMHSALFFARLGSTPGPVGFAALTALKDELPNYIKDKDELEQYQDKIQKSMYELSNAEMLKRQGQFDAGEKARHETIKDLSDFYKDHAHAEAESKTAAAHTKTAEASMITALAGRNKSGLGQERLDLATQQAIDKEVKNRFPQANTLATLKMNPTEKSKPMIDKLQAQYDEIRGQVEREYKGTAAPAAKAKPADYSGWGKVTVGP